MNQKKSNKFIIIGVLCFIVLSAGLTFALSSVNPEAGGMVFRFFVIPVGIAGLICLFLQSRMCDVRIAGEAQHYVTDGGMTFTMQEDIFTHTTEQRERINNDDKNDRDEW